MSVALASGLGHIARNLWHGRKLPAFPAVGFGAYLVEPLGPDTFAAALALYRMLNPGARLGFSQRLVLRLMGSRFCLIARPAALAGTPAVPTTTPSTTPATTPAVTLAHAPAGCGGPPALQPTVAAFTLFYFNARDTREGSIHAGYNGLHPAAQGAGLGTFMLRHALTSYARAGLAGASSRVSISNRAALKANEKAGFLPLETYFDAAAGEERHYLVCALGRYRDRPPEAAGPADPPETPSTCNAPAPGAAQGKEGAGHGR